VPKQSPGDDKVGRMQFLLGLRRRGISDPAVLRAMDEVPREHFVENAFVDSAYADQALPIACGQTISQPYVVAYMTEHLGVQGGHRVLEVGTGSGYQAAVLSRLAREVVSVERYRTLADIAPDRAPYDRIIVTAAAETVPDALLADLADGGAMVLPLGPHAGPQRLVKLTKGEQGINQEDLIGVRFVPLLPGKAREL
jgi:protein-L-isoaspartate(D-aspartate) O-methyltransferase